MAHTRADFVEETPRLALGVHSPHLGGGMGVGVHAELVPSPVHPVIASRSGNVRIGWALGLAHSPVKTGVTA